MISEQGTRTLNLQASFSGFRQVKPPHEFLQHLRSSLHSLSTLHMLGQGLKTVMEITEGHSPLLTRAASKIMLKDFRIRYP